MNTPGSHIRQSIVVGLAMFSMFFGSGNLIFPLFVGQLTQNNYIFGAIGFILTAVLLPLLGVVAMLAFDGNYREFFTRIGRWPGYAITFLILVFWIPFGSGPRCVTLAYAALQDDFGLQSLPLFSFIYTLLIFALAIKKNRIIDFLGYILTPALLTCLSLVIYLGLSKSHGLQKSSINQQISFLTGLLEGYNTMDLIASFFFSSSIIGMLKENKSRLESLKQTALGSLLAVGLLSAVYLGLMSVAAHNSSLLSNLSKDRMLAALASELLGNQLGIITSLCISLACITTSLALVLVFSDFLHFEVFREKVHRNISLLISSLITYLMACTGFETISALSTPVFQILYPLLIALIIYNLIAKKLGHVKVG